MANVFTRRSHYPRSTTQRDFCGPLIEPTEISTVQLCRVSSQLQESSGMWHHDSKTSFGMPQIQYRKRQIPVLRYTETTTSRATYRNPGRFPDLLFNQKITRFGYSPAKIPISGIIPHLNPKPYPPMG